MEDVLDIYERPYDPDIPVICMDEKPYQLLGNVRQPIPMNGNHPRIEDSEYRRAGTCSIFIMCEPKAGTRHASAREHRTAFDWAEEMKAYIEGNYADRERIILIMDNLNTHTIASFYKAFPPEDARGLARKLEIHFTPKHGSWLNIAECELNALTRQCLGRRLDSLEAVQAEIKAWCVGRNDAAVKVDWQFTCDDARIRLRHLYPDYKNCREVSI